MRLVEVMLKITKNSPVCYVLGGTGRRLAPVRWTAVEGGLLLEVLEVVVCYLWSYSQARTASSVVRSYNKQRSVIYIHVLRFFKT